MGIDIGSFEHRDNCFEINFLKSSRILIDLDSRLASTSSFGKRRTFWLNHVEYENSTRNLKFAPIFNISNSAERKWEYFENIENFSIFVSVEILLDKVKQREREANFFFDIGTSWQLFWNQFFEIFANFDRLRLSTCFDKFLRQEKNFLVKSRGIREFYEKFAQWQKGNENILRILRIFRFSWMFKTLLDKVEQREREGNFFFSPIFVNDWFRRIQWLLFRWLNQ